VTGPDGGNIEEPALARTHDGVLHVAWQRKNGTQVDLVHSTLSLEGRPVGQPVTMFQGWAALNNPDLLVQPDGSLRVFFGGIRSIRSTDPNQSLNTAVAPPSGESWELQDGRASAGTSAYASPVGATLLRDGTPAAAWAVTGGLFVHVGVDPTEADQRYQDACCAYQPALATDATTGEVVLGWYSNAAGQNGLYTQTVAPARGPRQYLPGSADDGRNSALSIDQKMALSARREAAGVYAAYGTGYPTFKKVVLWRHGTASPVTVASAEGARHVNLAAAPEGRLWVMWARAGRLYAVRTNRAAARFGPTLAVDAPAGTDVVFKLKGEGSLGPLDLFTRVGRHGAPGTAAWHTRLLPPLALSAAPASFEAKQGGRITFTVTDVGDPVAGAAVSFAGQTLTTDDRGQATASVAKGRATSMDATARRWGYTTATARIRAR
jgi:hypothetical protein